MKHYDIVARPTWFSLFGVGFPFDDTPNPTLKPYEQLMIALHPFAFVIPAVVVGLIAAIILFA